MNANNEQTANIRHVFVLKQISRKEVDATDVLRFTDDF